MKKYPLVIAAASLVLSIIIFVFASGARRIYSGLLFLAIAITQIVYAFRKSDQ